MNKSTQLYIFILCFFSSLLFSQSEVNFKICPQNILHTDLPMLPISLEYKTGKYSAELGYGIQTTHDLNYNRFNMSYYRLRLGLKYYFREKNSKQFIGFNVDYTPISFEKYDYDNFNFGVNYKDIHYDYDYSKINIDHIKLALLYGIRLHVTKRFFFEAIGGVGVKRRISKHQATGITIEPYKDEGITYSALDEELGNSYVEYLLLNVRIGYTFFKPKKEAKPTVID